jgi:Fe2+ transport system protein FeoA
MGLMPLEYVPCGHWADVEQIGGEPNWIGRMAELGVRVGTRIRVLQPGSPCILEIGQSRLSLRGEESFQVLVRPLPVAG